MVVVHSYGNFAKTSKYLKKMKKNTSDRKLMSMLHDIGAKGVASLASATPKDSGLTADSWTFSVVNTELACGVRFKNTNVNNGYDIAIMIQIGHGTGTGGWVEGRDYINPALAPVFEQMVKKLERVVK